MKWDAPLTLVSKVPKECSVMLRFLKARWWRRLGTRSPVLVISMLSWLPVTCRLLGDVEISSTAKRRLAAQSNGVVITEAVGSK